MRRLLRLGLLGLSLAAAAVPIIVAGCGDKDTIILYAEGGPGSGGASGATGSGGANAGSAGAATSGGAASGGSGPTSGGASSGGATSGGSAGSAAGGSGGMNCGPGQGLGIVPTNGLYDTNCVGIAGSAYSYADQMGTYLGITSDDGHFCVGGMIGDGANGAWGGTIEYQLNAPGGASPLPYNATSHGVTGFAFDITGPQIPPTLEIQYAADGDAQTYCVMLAAGHHDIAFSEAHIDCGTSGATPDPTSLTLIRFVSYATVGATMPVDFCVDNLTATQ